MIEKFNQDKCLDCKVELKSINRHPVYSSRLAVMGYICADCREKRKTPAMTIPFTESYGSKSATFRKNLTNRSREQNHNFDQL